MPDKKKPTPEKLALIRQIFAEARRDAAPVVAEAMAVWVEHEEQILRNGIAAGWAVPIQLPADAQTIETQSSEPDEEPTNTT